jgi:tetratricopeptide (TPR) repeat protein
LARDVTVQSSASGDLPGRQKLEGQLVVFTGKLSSLARKDASTLVARLGGAVADDVTAKTTVLVIGDEVFGASKSNKLRRAEELNAARPESRIRILSEAEFCNLVGVPTPATLKRQYHALRDLMTRYPALREDHVRFLTKYGVVRPVLRTNADSFFAFPDLAAFKQANDQLRQGVSFRTIVRTLLASSHGQLAFDFRLDASPARVLELRRQTGSRAEPRADLPRVPSNDSERAEGLFNAASMLDDGSESQREEAAALYRKALELDPYLVAALINLANIHYGRDDLAEAQALYERAIGLQSDFFEAHFNLGNIYHDLGHFDEARDCYLQALRLNPHYAEAHFYLAVTFEKMARSQDARPHWRAYRQLAPNGEWAELAKEFSD